MFLRTRLIRDLTVVALIDSGCTHTCIRSDLWDVLQKRGAYLRPVTAEAIVANGQTAEIVGVTTLVIAILTPEGSKTWKGDCLLVKFLPHDAIIGCNTMRELECVLDFRSETLTLQPGGKPFRTEPEPDCVLDTVSGRYRDESAGLQFSSPEEIKIEQQKFFPLQIEHRLKLQGVVDTGSTATLIHNKFSFKLREMGKEINKYEGTLTQADGSMLQVLGRVRGTLSLKLLNEVIHWEGEFLLVDSLQHQAILGMDAIRGFGLEGFFNPDQEGMMFRVAGHTPDRPSFKRPWNKLGQERFSSVTGTSMGSSSVSEDTVASPTQEEQPLKLIKTTRGEENKMRIQNIETPSTEQEACNTKTGTRNKNVVNLRRLDLPMDPMGMVEDPEGHLSRLEIKALAVKIDPPREWDFDQITDPWYIKTRTEVGQCPEKSSTYSVEDNVLYRTIKTRRLGNPYVRRIVVPEEYRAQVLKENHEDPTSGHPGFHRTLKRLTLKYYWPRMTHSVGLHVKKCESCQKGKATNKRPAGLMHIPPTQPLPGQFWSADIAGPLPKSVGGYQYIVIFIDLCSRWPIAVPLRTVTAKTVTAAFTDHVVQQYGCPRLLLVDNGPQFCSRLLQNYCEERKIPIRYIPRYYARANPTERSIRNIKTMLAIYAKEENRLWSVYLPYVIFGLRTTINDATGFTPSRLFLGRELRSYYELSALDPPSDLEKFDPFQFEGKMSAEMEEILKKVQSCHEKAKRAQKKQYDLRRREVSYNEGEVVLRKNHQKSDGAAGVSAKLLEKWVGPFVIKKKVGVNQYVLENLDGKEAGRWHVSELKEFVT